MLGVKSTASEGCKARNGCLDDPMQQREKQELCQIGQVAPAAAALAPTSIRPREISRNRPALDTFPPLNLYIQSSILSLSRSAFVFPISRL